MNEKETVNNITQNTNTDSKQKTATNNQWVSTGLTKPCDKTDRRDGPGGENGK